MSKRSYKEAVEIMVKWWSEKSFKTRMNQNNGDSSENGAMSFMLMNMVSENAKEDLTEDKIKMFEDKLIQILLPHEGKPKFYNELYVDYHPNSNLSEALNHAGIDGSCLPCKTFTFINEENEIQGRYQYGGGWFTL